MTYERYLELDENGELFNEDLTQEAVVLHRGNMDNGYSMAEATTAPPSRTGSARSAWTSMR